LGVKGGRIRPREAGEPGLLGQESPDCTEQGDGG